MANTFLTVQQIARAALPILHDNLVFPALSYKEFCGGMGKKGDVVQIKKPAVYSADEFTNEISVQDIKENSVLVTLDKIADVSVELTAKEMALDLEDFTKQVIAPAAAAIAEKINADGLALYKDIPYTCGTAGTTPSGIETFAAVSKALNDAKAPLSDRFCVWNSAALASFQSDAAIISAEKCGTTRALRNGSIGRLIGLENYMSQQVCTHTKGTLSGTLKIAEAAEAGSDAIKISCTSGTLVKGDILVINDSEYVVLQDAAAASSSVTAKIYPCVPESGFAAQSPVSLMGDHAANLAFHKNAFGFVSRPLEKARGAESYVTSFDGISLRVTFAYDISTKKQTMSVDTLYGFKTLYPELAVRVLG
jgi:signal peptidase I